jgi:hypothetical protein
MNLYNAVFLASVTIMLPVMTFAGNDQIPSEEDKVMIGCKLESYDRLGEYVKLDGNSYTHDRHVPTNREFAFALVYSGQESLMTAVAPGVFDREIFNRWRFVSMGTNTCASWRSEVPHRENEWFTLMARTCDARGDGQWGLRDFVLTRGYDDEKWGFRTAVIKPKIPYFPVAWTHNTSPNGSGAQNVFTAPTKDLSHRAVSYIISGCRNRNNEPTNPMKYNR